MKQLLREEKLLRQELKIAEKRQAIANLRQSVVSKKPSRFPKLQKAIDYLTDTKLAKEGIDFGYRPPKKKDMF